MIIKDVIRMTDRIYSSFNKNTKFPFCKVTVFSNPAYTDFKLVAGSNDKNTPVSLKVMDISGKIIETKQAVIPNQQISIGAGYKSGIYICEFIQADKRSIIKLVKL